MKDDGRITVHDGEQRLLDLLKDLPVPEAEQGFYDRALVQAARDGTRRQRNRWLVTGFASAAAAAVVILLVSGLFPGGDLPSPAVDPIPGVTITMAEPETVNLVFASAEALDDATLSLTLPAGVELAGFPGQREIRWQTSLRPGRNLLPLDLVAVAPGGGEVVATLSHDSRERTFRLRIDVG
jgi:hypothetical protein